MQAAALETKGVTSPVRRVRRLSDLDAVLDDALDGVIFERRLPPVVLTALSEMPLDPVMGDRFCLSPDQVAGCMGDIFAEWGLELGAAETWVAEDVQSLAVELARVLAIANVILRVEVIADDACRKFHRDAIRARLICTYHGPGTEFGVAEACGEPDTVEHVPTGCPVVLKGKAWRDGGGAKLKHRSPPIEGTGVSRLVVVIDEALTGAS